MPYWPHILLDLKAAGYSLRGIQAATGVHKDRAHKIGKGSEPYYSEGTALLDLLQRSQEKPATVEHLRQGSVIEGAQHEVSDGRDTGTSSTVAATGS